MSESNHNSPEYDTSSFQGIRDALELAFHGIDFVETDDCSTPFFYDPLQEVVKSHIRSKSSFDSARNSRVHVMQVACELRPAAEREHQNMLFMTWEDSCVILVDIDDEELNILDPLNEQDSRPSRDQLTRLVIGGLSAVTSILD